jgi:hypothetical protein
MLSCLNVSLAPEGLVAMEEIEPSFQYEVDGFRYLGRGTGGGGWSRSPNFYYRCAKCGDMMQASFDDYYNCKCKAVHLDIDAGRFGSHYGDQNILRYEKLSGGPLCHFAQ